MFLLREQVVLSKQGGFSLIFFLNEQVVVSKQGGIFGENSTNEQDTIKVHLILE